MIRTMNLVGRTSTDWTEHPHSVWVDAEAPTPDELALLRRVFAFNPLALEDALTEGQWSRFEAYREHVFLVFRTLDDPAACTDATERVSIFWYPATDTLVTIRLRHVHYLDRTWNEFQPLSHGSEERLIYTLLARGADTFFEFTDALEERTDALEERMLQSGEAGNFAREVFAYKHLLLSVRRLVSGARESVSAFARHSLIVTNSPRQLEGELALRFDPGAQEIASYFRDVVDSLARVYDSLDSAREVLSSILDVHLTVQQGRVNEVMRTLTTVSTVFLPLTFLAGVWGMNFQHMPELAWRYGYLMAWASFLLVAVGLAVYFKRRGWW